MNFTEKFIQNCKQFPRRKVFAWWDENGEKIIDINAEELLKKSSKIACFIRSDLKMQPGDRAILVYPPSMEFVYAFLGCILTGVIPVPVYPPRPHKFESDLEKCSQVVEDCKTEVALTTSMYKWVKRLHSLKGLFSKKKSSWQNLKWHVTDKISNNGDPIIYQPNSEDIAFLQYTSGSTSIPKGVMISHKNIIHQLEYNQQSLQLSKDTVAVSWLPQYHDFGLISCILSAAYGNGYIHMMSPLTFIQRPFLWMEIISRVKATHTAAPNFAYELIVRKSTEKQRSSLNLSSLSTVMSAAEPIRHKTIQKFQNAFAVSGLRPESYSPAYGMAEHTVGVSVNGKAVVDFDKRQLEKRKVIVVDSNHQNAVKIVGCGKFSSDIDVQIVDPEKCTLAEGIGEIWVNSDSKASGYYGMEELTQKQFRAQIQSSTNTTEYLRTGDLGFIYEDEIFVVGRCKELMIFQGRNVYPQDIEEAARYAHESIRPGGLSAFATDNNEQEELVVFVEIREAKIDKEQAEKIANQVKIGIQSNCQLVCHTVVIGKVGLVLKTTSGKVRRGACQIAFLEENFSSNKNILFVVRNTAQKLASDDSKQIEDLDSAVKSLENVILSLYKREQSQGVLLLEEALQKYVSALIGQSNIDINKNLLEYGIDSLALAEFTTTIEKATKKKFMIQNLLQHANIHALAIYIYDEFFASLRKFIYNSWCYPEEFINTVRMKPLVAEVKNIQKHKNSAIKTRMLINRNFDTTKVKKFLRKTNTTEVEKRGVVSKVSKKIVGLSSGQRRVLAIQQQSGKSINYHAFQTTKISGPFNIEIYKKSLEIVMQRHDSLRIIFQPVMSKYLQKLNEDLEVPFTFLDLQNEPQGQEKAMKYLVDLEDKSFDLFGENALWRAVVIRLATDEYWVSFVFHHLIADGWSLEILQQELQDIYNTLDRNEEYTALAADHNFFDYSVAQSRFLQKDLTNTRLEFWKNNLAENISAIEKKDPCTNNVACDGVRHNLYLDKNLLEEFTNITQAAGVMPFLPYLASFYLAFHESFDDQPNLIGCYTANREYEEIKNTVGYFTNILLLKLKNSESLTFVEFIKYIQDIYLKAHQNSLPISFLIKKLLPSIYPYRIMPCSVAFNIIPFVNLQWHINQCEATFYPLEVKSTFKHFDLIQTVAFMENEILLHTWHNKNVFDPIKVQQMLKIFKSFLESIVENPSVKIIDICQKSQDLAEQRS
ncbi:condensation domain-containing protein [Candidatus Uabimicrobium sp. HlEnr_7]|uniref:condensation domain-containing protein n=1 Tax=Candidatus Uabimicrobium helgolandensis TaxID=3095367 RepID=UPI00355689B7